MPVVDLGDRDFKAADTAVLFGTIDRTNTTLQTITRASGEGVITGISGFARITTAASVAVSTFLTLQLKFTVDGGGETTQDILLMQYESGDTSRKDFFTFNIPITKKYSSSLTVKGALSFSTPEIATVHVVANIFESRTS
jgi:hypothetical protein